MMRRTASGSSPQTAGSTKEISYDNEQTDRMEDRHDGRVVHGRETDRA